MKIDVEQDGFNRTLNFRFNFNDGEEVFIGIGSEQQYLKLCEIINEINSNV